MRRPASTPLGVSPDEKGGRTPAKSPTPENDRSANENVIGSTVPSKGRKSPIDPKAIPGVVPASAIEPLLKLTDLTRVLNCQLRTVERLKSSGRLPKPDLLIGTGTRKSPRWKPATIRRWIDEGGAE